jgi:hypothetical protein
VSAYTSIQDPHEGRNVDFMLEIGMDATNAFFKNATPDDVLGAIESNEEKWPLEKLIELRDKLQDVILHEAAQTGPERLRLMTNDS